MTYQFAVYFICVDTLHMSTAIQRIIFLPYSSINLIVWSCILLIILMLYVFQIFPFQHKVIEGQP